MSTIDFPAVQRRKGALLLALGALTFSCSATAVPLVTPLPAPAAKVLNTRTISLSFKQLGLSAPLTLRGIEGTASIPFNIRADEVVVGARLKLVYNYSPALLPETSHLAVLLNGEVATSIALPKVASATTVTRDIALDTRAITEFNRLGLKLIGHYTEQCEDPMHTSLWASISPQSTIEFTVTSVALDNELALLPAPFFDRRDAQRLLLPFVFNARPAVPTLEAAGTLASWFGKLAGYRGAQFPALLNSLPASGHAVVLATPQEVPAGLVLPAISGPTIAVVTHPNDAQAKLLLVMGRDSEELKRAVQALVLSGRNMSGASSLVSDLAPIAPRLPYDAPNWISAERPVPLSELTTVADLSVTGYQPEAIRVNLRLPPDLFGWQSKGVPLDVRYRYTPRPVADASTLNVGINGEFISAIKIPAVQQMSGLGWFDRLLPATTSQASKRIMLPSYALQSTSQLQFQYHYDYKKDGDCRNTLPQNVMGTIDGDSSIDLTGLPHFLAMPNLAVFANSGFPFTRMADLSQSAVILPQTILPVHLSTYLTLMGRMGESTGYPATGVKLALAADVAALADKDLLVLGDEQDQPLLSLWKQLLPIASEGRSQTVRPGGVVATAHSWWQALFGKTPVADAARTVLRQGEAGALLMGFESPLQAGRSVVVVQASKDASFNDVQDALLSSELVGKIHGSAVAVRHLQVQSVEEAETYHVGELPIIEAVQWWLSTRPGFLALMAAFSSGFLGLIAFFSLRRRAADRLK